MRVTFALSYDRTTQNINRMSQDLERLTSSMSSGKRLLKPSDDPIGWSQSMELKQGFREMETLQKNMDFAVNWNHATENALTQLSDEVVRAKEVAIRSVSVQSPEMRAAQVSQLDEIIGEAVSTANSQYRDRYLFSVNSTEAPFKLTGASGGVAQVESPADLSGVIKVRVGNGRHETVNVDGASVFNLEVEGQQTDILQELVALRNAIQDNDQEKILKQQDVLDGIREQLSRQTSLVGTRLDGLENRQNALESLKLEQHRRLSDVEEADMYEVITRVTQKQTTFEAALRVTGMLDGLNLVQFL